MKATNSKYAGKETTKRTQEVHLLDRQLGLLKKGAGQQPSKN